MKIKMTILGLILASPSLYAQTPELQGGYRCLTGCDGCAQVKQDGTELDFYNEDGGHSPGKVLSNTLLQANVWKDNTGGALNGQILTNPTQIAWENGTTWTMTDNCPAPE